MLLPNRVFGASDSFATAQLIQERFERNSLELLAVLRVLRGRGLSEIAEPERLLRTLPGRQFNWIWSAPDAYWWMRLAYGYAKDGFEDTLISKFAKWARLTPESFGRGLGERLMLIALSGQAMAGCDMRLDMPVPLPCTGSMVGTPIAWMLAEGLQVFGTTNGRLLAGTSLESARPLDPTNFDGVLRMPEVRGIGISIDVWSECVRADFPGLEQTERIGDLSTLQRQAKAFMTALSIIRTVAAPAYDEVSLVLRSACPLVGSGSSLPSSSTSAITGAMWYTQTDVPELLAEMIIHEFSHSKLFLLQDADALLDGTFHGTGWEARAFYSPWRDDPRPLNAILHAYVVFSEAALFWARRLQKDDLGSRELALRRFGMLVRQIELARKVLEGHCRLTPTGQAIMDYFAARLDGVLLPLAARWQTDGLPVLHVERHTEFESRDGATVAASVAAHRERWESRYGASVAP